MDLNVTVGGESVYLPASSTGYLTVDNILDLSAGSSIRAISQQDIDNKENYGLALGDYVLVQDAADTHSSVNIEQITINDTDVNSEGITVPFAAGLSYTMPADFTSDISLSENNVDPCVKSAEQAETDLELLFNIRYSSELYRGDITINKGYSIDFSEDWIVSIEDPTTATFARMDNDHKLVFTSDVKVGYETPFAIRVKVNRFILGSEKGEGLYEPGHFMLNSTIAFAGDVSIDDSTADHQIGDVDIDADIYITKALILAITGVVDPEITIDDTLVRINDIPDFLSSDDNYLDLSDPQIYFTVDNQSPVSVTVTAKLTGIYSQDKAPVNLYIGEWANQNGTEAIIVKPGLNKICLSRTGENHGTGIVEVKVPNIGDLLTTIPSEIVISDIDMKVIQQPVTFVLSAPGESGYAFDAKYAAVVPLSFSNNMKLVYEDSDNGWDEEFEKYNFNTVEIKLDVLNTVPLTLVPDVEMTRADGSVLENLVIDIDGEVAAGSISSPSTSGLTIIARSKGENLAGLNGIKYIFTAKSGQNTTGVVLNENQNLKFENIKITIKGGVTIDLND
ncbi:MAG: hypothetical protein HDS68_04335 [Bacteroidales bacterium]|nr:hypothetical protein [Bacteroidales bacterium]